MALLARHIQAGVPLAAEGGTRHPREKPQLLARYQPAHGTSRLSCCKRVTNHNAAARAAMNTDLFLSVANRKIRRRSATSRRPAGRRKMK